MGTMTEAAIAANRFGLGARPNELLAAQSDPRGWLKAQLGQREIPEAIAALPSSSQVFKAQAQAIQQRREAKRAEQDRPESNQPETNQPASTNSEAVKPGNMVRTVYLQNYLQQVVARYQVATHSDRSFHERLVHFWSNHFAVSADKLVVGALAGTLENEAIRPNLNGHFYNLLLAAESHPAMILYLDNQASAGPNSPLAMRAQRRQDVQRKLDINENLGREILELHTLGVKGGYSQADVTAFARVLSGWSVGGGQGRLQAGIPGEFVFREALHEPGAQTVLGKRYAEGGIDQPRAVLKDLARHTATAPFIATKLARHFIADDPPASAVAQIAKVFRDTDGNLPKVHAALVDCAQAWLPAANKFKTPHEFVLASFRALDSVPDQPMQVLAPFELLGQRPFTPGSPAGWADTAGQWDGPDALLKRIEWATQAGQRIGGRLAPINLAQQTLGVGLDDHTRSAILGAADAAQGIVLWLMSPEFQRR